MIQRIQTIYLLLSSITSGGLIFIFNLWISKGEKIFVLDLFSNKSISLQLIPIMFCISSILAIVNIFIFNNRKLQFVIGRILILINLFLLGLLIYQSLMISGEISEKGIGMFLPILAILLLVLANKAIKKDEDLVKSVDRLR